MADAEFAIYPGLRIAIAHSALSISNWKLGFPPI
jgi:hypothetical protein